MAFLEMTNLLMRSCLLYDFKSGLNAADSWRRLWPVFGNDLIAERTLRKHFKRFKDEGLTLDDKPDSRRSSEVDKDRLRELVKQNPYVKARKYGETKWPMQPFNPSTHHGKSE